MTKNNDRGLNDDLELDGRDAADVKAGGIGVTADAGVADASLANNSLQVNSGVANVDSGDDGQSNWASADAAGVGVSKGKSKRVQVGKTTKSVTNRLKSKRPR